MIATIVVSCVVGACAATAAIYVVRRKIKNRGRCADCKGNCFGCPSKEQNDKACRARDKKTDRH